MQKQLSADPIEKLKCLRNDFKDFYRVDEELREIERGSEKFFLEYVIQYARTLNEDSLDAFFIPSFASTQEALNSRYIQVPLLYKLGMNREASLLAQAAFENLFPEFHQAIQNRLEDFFGKNYLENCEKIIKNFSFENSQIGRISSRIKKTHSIWRKIPSLSVLEAMAKEEFLTCVDDLVGIRWEMNVQENENRYDALINGVRLSPRKELVSFRNQMLKQQSGFDSEPVMKLCYVIDGIPLELQLLGGNLTQLMSAKGYANYKAKMIFPPKKDELSEEMWNRRLGMVISQEEEKDQTDFRKKMLLELITQLDYSPFTPFLLDEAPMNEENRTMRFSESMIPIWELPSLKFYKTIDVR